MEPLKFVIWDSEEVISSPEAIKLVGGKALGLAPQLRGCLFT